MAAGGGKVGGYVVFDGGGSGHGAGRCDGSSTHAMSMSVVAELLKG
jgi:hypothetical protein